MLVILLRSKCMSIRKLLDKVYNHFIIKLYQTTEYKPGLTGASPGVDLPSRNRLENKYIPQK